MPPAPSIMLLCFHRRFSRVGDEKSRCKLGKSCCFDRLVEKSHKHDIHCPEDWVHCHVARSLTTYTRKKYIRKKVVVAVVLTSILNPTSILMPEPPKLPCT